MEPDILPSSADDFLQITLPVNIVQPTLRINDKGDSVRILQRALNLIALDSARVNVDGDFGTRTRNAVRRFQTAQTLVVDGVVGANTWTALVHELERRRDANDPLNTGYFQVVIDAIVESPSIDKPPPGLPVPDKAIRYVTATSLNVRSTPSLTSDSNIIGSLRLATPVMFIEKATNTMARVQLPANWTGRGPRVTDAWVSTRFLRHAAEPHREALVRSAVEQWVRFDYGQGMETNHPFDDYIGEFWRAIDLPHDGDDTDIAWSGAAICFMIRNSGHPYPDFVYSAGHWAYINDAIAVRDSNRSGPFHAFRISEAKPEVGDIIARSRTRPPVTFDLARQHSQNPDSRKRSYKSHCDIVIAVTDTEVHTIGGNVRNSVNVTSYDLDENGQIQSDSRAFAILKNRAA